MPLNKDELEREVRAGRRHAPTTSDGKRPPTDATSSPHKRTASDLGHKRSSSTAAAAKPSPRKRDGNGGNGGSSGNGSNGLGLDKGQLAELAASAAALGKIDEAGISIPAAGVEIPAVGVEIPAAAPAPVTFVPVAFVPSAPTPPKDEDPHTAARRSWYRDTTDARYEAGVIAWRASVPFNEVARAAAVLTAAFLWTNCPREARWAGWVATLAIAALAVFAGVQETPVEW